MDEGSLLTNLVDLPIFDFSTTLSKDQLAPPGFLAVERMMVRLPLPTVWAARLIPLLCGIASMFLMRSVARRYLSPRAVPIAVGLFALDDWLIYYAVEIKQYCSDTTLTLVALLLASAAAGLSRRRLLVLAGFGAVGVWFSHPLAMVLGGRGDLPGGEGRDSPRLEEDGGPRWEWACSGPPASRLATWFRIEFSARNNSSGIGGTLPSCRFRLARLPISLATSGR